MDNKKYFTEEEGYELAMSRYERLKNAIREKEEKEGIKEPIEIKNKVVHSYTMLTSKKYLGSDDEK